MRAVIRDAGRPPECHPLTLNRSLAELPIGNQPLAVVQEQRIQSAGLEAVINVEENGSDLLVPGHSWLSLEMLHLLSAASEPVMLKDEQGETLAWTASIGDEEFSEAKAIACDKESFRIRYPWDLLRVNEILLDELTTTEIAGEVSSRSEWDGNIFVGEGTQILPGVYIEGNVVIGKNSKIGPNCYLRGATSIGSHCHIGQGVEIKNSLIMDRTSIGHLSYCGDCVIGERVNFGAGTVVANLRHDGKNHQSMLHETGILVDTGRRKLGVIVGDDVHTGINTSIYPGRKLWPHTFTLPGSIVQRDMLK